MLGTCTALQQHEIRLENAGSDAPIANHNDHNKNEMQCIKLNVKCK